MKTPLFFDIFNRQFLTAFVAENGFMFGTVILKTGDTARTWHVEGEWEQSYGGRKPEEFTTPRTLIVIPDESDDSATPARCEILFSGHILDEDTLENSETQAICNFESWNQE